MVQKEIDYKNYYDIFKDKEKQKCCDWCNNKLFELFSFENTNKIIMWSLHGKEIFFHIDCAKEFYKNIMLDVLKAEESKIMIKEQEYNSLKNLKNISKKITKKDGVKMSYKEEKEFISKLQKYFNVELLNDSIFVFDDFKLLGTEITDSIKIYVKKTCMNNFKEFMNDNGYKRNTEDLFSDLYEKKHFTSIEVFDHKGVNQTKESVIRDLFISNKVKNYKKIIKICENIINNYDEIKAKADEENL